MGLPLRPYTLGHEIMLLAERNLFLCSPDIENEPLENWCVDLQRAADICSMDWAENHFRPKSWIEALKHQKAYKKWAKVLKKSDFFAEIPMFRAYLSVGRSLLPVLSSSMPEDAEAYELANNAEKMGSGRSLGAPLLAQLLTFAMVDLHLTKSEAMDSQFSEIGNLYFANLESEGSLYIENYKELEARNKMTTFRAESKAEREAAQSAWDACMDDESRTAAFEAYPKIGELFSKEWNEAKTPQDKHEIEQKWPMVADKVLSAAHMRGVTCPE